MNKIKELNNNIIQDINRILKRDGFIDEADLNKIISDFILITRIYNSQYKVEPYDLWGNGYDFIKFDLSDCLGFDRSMFSLQQNGDNLTLMFGQEAVLAVRNVIFDRFSNEFLMSCAQKFNIAPFKFDFVVSRNFIFGRNETIQNAGDHSFIETLDYLESGQTDKIREFKYVYTTNDYNYNTVMIDRVDGIKIESTKDTFQIFDFDISYLDNPVDFSIEGPFEERITRLTNVRKVSENLVDSSNDSFTLVKKSD